MNEFSDTSPEGRVVSLSSLPETGVERGDTIGPIDALKGFDTVEWHLARLVVPDETKFFRREVPLSTLLRPKPRTGSFLGRLTNGFAWVLPETDTDVLSRRLRGKQLDQDQTVSAITGADIYSSAGGVVGMVVRQVIYFEKTSIDDGQRVGRYMLGTKVFGQDGRDIVEDLQKQSAERAANFQRWAIKHPYQGGGAESSAKVGRGSIYYGFKSADDKKRHAFERKNP